MPEGFLRNQIVLEATVAFSIGVVLVLFDAIRALRGWGGRRRWVTFADQMKIRLATSAIAILIVAVIIAILFRSATAGAYAFALLLAAVQTLCVILGILVLDSILRVPTLIRGLFRGRVPRSESAVAGDQDNDR